MKRLIGVVAFIIPFLVGCNLYSPFDSPSGDLQYLSAARACLDDQDFTCALQNYQKVSGTYSDTVNSEEAFMVLDQQNAGMKQFISAFGKGSNPVLGFNTLAGFLALGQGVSGQTRRLAILGAYLTNAKAIVNPQLANFTKFVVAAVLSASVLGEQAATAGTYLKTDIAVNPTGCTTVPNVNCNVPNTSTLIAGTGAIGADTTDSIPLDAATVADVNFTGFNGAPSAYMISASIQSALFALKNLGSSAAYNLTFATQIADTAISGDPTLESFNLVLLQAGLGN